MKYVQIDFEFNSTAEPQLNLVCCSLQIVGGEVEEFWLYRDDEGKERLRNRLLELKDHTFLAHQVSAEASSFTALGLKPLDFKWICTFLEWRHITNHYRKLRYGKHLIKGKEKNLIPAMFDKFKEDQSKDTLKHGLAEMCYKLLGKKIDTDHKKVMRDIIISNDPAEIEENKEEIQKYCTSDIEHLYPCLEVIVSHYNKLIKGKDKASIGVGMYARGRQMVRVSLLERLGYPIDLEKTQNFSRSVSSILSDMMRDINQQFPDMGVFQFNKRTGRYVKKEKPIKEWVDSLPYAKTWEKTKTGNYSLSLEAFAKHFNYKHEYPRYNFGAQMLRYLKLKQSLNGMIPPANRKKDQKLFWDYVGSDGRVRPNLNPYGSQSARFQPAATGFIFLKPAWQRALVSPPKGKFICGIDYKSEEYLIAALESGDKKMIQAYLTGDVYMDYAIGAKLAPKGATKKSHPEQRDMSKPIVLGINYDMSKYGLSKDMTDKLGRVVSEEEAQDYIDLFYERYSTFAEFKKDIQDDYESRGYLKAPHHWFMWGENYNFRSVGNFPIQSAGAAILWKAIELCQDASLNVIIPLHDALYIEGDIEKFSETIELFAECMVEAFNTYYPDSGIMIDLEAWSPEFKEVGSLKVKEWEVKVENVHIDERAASEYEKFKKYFNKPDSDYL